MAHIEKIKRAAVGQMVYHTRRLRVDGTYKNELIDSSRTPLNYRLGGVPDVTAEIGRIAQGTPKGKLRKDAVAMFSVCDTLPRDWPPERDSREFFEACHAFNLRFFGGVSLGMDVHLDETTPHAHDLFCPRTADGRVCYNEVVPRSKYQRYHAELQKHLKDVLGLDLAITLPDEERTLKALSPMAQQEYVRARQEAVEADKRAMMARMAAEDAERREMASEGRREALEAEVQRLTAEKRDLEGMVDSLWAYVQEFIDQVWDAVMRAWADHGPWTEEKDQVEVDAAVKQVMRGWRR